MSARRPSLALAALLALAACASPEAARVRGGDRGADTGNRDLVVEMHEGSQMFYKTPCLMPEDECTGPPQASGMSDVFPDEKARSR